MKAIRFHETGGPEVLRFEDVELGAPGPGEVRVRHTAVALNFRDILVRRGQHAPKLPSGLGSESAGVIEAIGPGVTGLAAGDRVTCVSRPDCAYAEARNAPAVRVLKLPNGIDERTAASPEPVSVRELGNMGSLYVTHPSLIDYTATRAELSETANDLFAMVGSGKIKVAVNHTFPLREAAQAHRDVESRKTTGSVLLIP